MSPIDRVFLHEGYDNDTQHNDIALLKLKTPLKLDDRHAERAVCLPGRNVTADDWKDLKCKTAGWGWSEAIGDYADRLRAVGVEVKSQKTCSEYLLGEEFEGSCKYHIS